MTYHPTTRVLAVLELLQTYHQLSAAELARRLEVDRRTVRRYIAMLQELGIPVATTRGRYGGYHLRPGYKLPPLIFSEGEALAVLLGLMTAAQQNSTGSNAEAMAALAKIARVLPADLRQRWAALQETVVLHEPLMRLQPPPAEILGTLALAIRDERPVWLRYRSSGDEETERLVEPFGLVFLLGTWYLAGYCHLRTDRRIFRIDRMLRAEPRLGHCPKPADFDPLVFVRQKLIMMPARWSVEVLLHLPLEEARREVLPMLAVLTETPAGVLFRCTCNNLRWLARRLLGLECTWEIRQPPELIDELRQLAAECLAGADRSAAVGTGASA